MNKTYNIKTQEQAIIHFLKHMDIEMIDSFLSELNTYQEMNKDLFLSKLQKVFQIFISAGDTYLIPYPGKCNSCYKNKQGFTFIGNYSFNYISLIIDAKNGVIKDMFECSNFLNNDQSLILNNKVYLDDLLFNF